MKTIELEVSPRAETGKGFNRRLRTQGIIPAVLYGTSKKNFNIQTSTKVINLLVSGHNENAIITLKSPESGVNGKHVLIKEWARDVMTRLPLHVDFYEIDLKKSVRVKVPLHFTGKAKGAAEGGIVSPVIREIEVDCLPTAIPEFLNVDVTNLAIGESIHIEELVVPEGVKKHFADNFTIVTCSFIKEEVVVAPVEGAAALAEPEVIAKGKKDEEGADGKPAAGAKAPAGGGDKKAAAPAAAKGGDKK